MTIKPTRQHSVCKHFAAAVVLSMTCSLTLSAQEPQAALKGTETLPVEVTYRELLKSAAVSEFDGRKVRFNAVFFNIAVSNAGLPEKYKEHVRLLLCDRTIGHTICEAVMANALISKKKSAPVYKLNNGDHIRIEATARSATLPQHPNSLTPPPAPMSDSGGTGKPKTEAAAISNTQSKKFSQELLLEVESIEVIKLEP